MFWVINIIRGPLQGKSFKVSPGLTIGRKKADINLEDPKISSIHAIIEESGDGRFLLVDNHSRNGIFANGRQASVIELKDGLEIHIGSTLFEFIFTDDLDDFDTLETPADWREVLANFNSSIQGMVKTHLNEISPFTPVVELSFVRGQQLNTRWTLGYGPRSIGSHSFDLPIHEKDAPATCFKVIPSATKGPPVFKSNHPNEVLLNGKPVKSQVLKENDEITIGETLIRVQLIDV